MSNQTLTNKINVKMIEIDRGEGPSHLCGKRRFLTWKDANTYLLGVCMEKRINGGYDKCNFRIEFEDGEVYAGRYDAANPGGQSYEGPLGTGHIREHLEFCAGLKKPDWMTDAQYAETLARYKVEFPKLMDESLTWLTKYALTDPETAPATTEAPMTTAPTITHEKTAKEARAEHLARRDLEGLPPVAIKGNTFPIRRVLWALGGNYIGDTQTWLMPAHTAAEGQRIADEVNNRAKATAKAMEADHAARLESGYKAAKPAAVKATVTVPASPTAPATVKVRVITPAQVVAAAAPKATSKPSPALGKRVDCLLTGAKALQSAAEKEGNDTLASALGHALRVIEEAAGGMAR